MGRKKSANGGGEQKPEPAKTNGYDPAVVKNLVERIEARKADITSTMMKAVADCKPIHDDIRLVLDEAKEKGISKKALRAAVNARELERKAEAIRDDLEGEVQDSYDLIRHALGDLADTPLGEAATRKTVGDMMREPGGALAQH